MGTFFRNENTYDLKVGREQQFEAFAVALLDFCKDQGFEYEYAEEVCQDEPDLFSKFAESKVGSGLLEELHDQGSLDFLTTYLNSLPASHDSSEEWPLYSPLYSLDGVLDDVMTHGLHGLHFRVNMQNAEGRQWAVTALARHLYDLHSEAARDDESYPLMMLSTLIVDDYTHELRYAHDAVSDFAEQELDNFTKPELNTLLSLCAEVKGEVETQNALETGMKKFMSGRGETVSQCEIETMPRIMVAHRVEDGLLAMVYNYGYRLKASFQLSNYDLKEEIGPVIDCLLNQYPSSPEFHAALKRQIMINLFSAFPRGLEMFDAKPEELQGVMLDPVLREHPDAKHFLATLMGPVALFNGSKSIITDDKASCLINYLTEAGYPITVATASKGLMFDRPAFMHIIEHEAGSPDSLQDYLAQPRPLKEMPGNVIRALLRVDYLKKFSDAAALNIILKGIDLIADRTLQKINIAGFFKARPELVSEALDTLERYEMLTPLAFKSCGFGHKELRLLGKRAPDILAEHILGGDLGL